MSKMLQDNIIGILFDRIRWEEKEIAHQIEEQGSSIQYIDSKERIFNVDKSPLSFPHVVIERCVSFYRGISIASILEGQGVRVINSSKVLGLCGNKLTTSLLLSKNGIPSPRTIIAFSPESAKDAVEAIGYPCVMKPIVGSWGRQVTAIRNRETASALIELKEQGESLQSIFYLQEMIDRPPRDIRCISVAGEIVACVYRYSADDSWKTNVALGGHTERCPITEDLADLVRMTSKAVGGGILGIDLMENRKTGEFVVHEVNGTVEFRGAQAATEHSIAAKIAEYALNAQVNFEESGPLEKFEKSESRA